jgi:prepilin-type N-terminal cleavage/methylation domain-containing protein
MTTRDQTKRLLERCGGFTLIETLAALAITAVILVAGAGLVHDIVMGFDRGTRTITAAERLVLAVERLAGDFAAARFVQKAVDAGKGVAFTTGEENSGRLTFVSGANIAAGPRGEEIVSLSIEPTGDITRLVRRRAPWRGPSGRFGEVTPQDPVILIEGNYDMSFSFGKANPEGRMTWTSNWSDTKSIPQSVRLVIRDRTSGVDILPRAEFRLRSDMMVCCGFGGPGCESERPKQPANRPGANGPGAKPPAKPQEDAD